MKNLILSLGLVAAFATGSAQAQSTDRRQVIDEINALTFRVKDELRYTGADTYALQEIRDQLQTIVDTLRDGGSGGPVQPPRYQECVDWAYQKYYISLSSSAAMDRATAACRQITDLDAAKFLYEKHYISLSAAAAMDQAAAQTTSSNLRNKMDILEFAYTKYYISLSATAAATKAAQGTGTIRQGSLSCLQSAYTRRYVSLSAAAAMDAAFTDCTF